MARGADIEGFAAKLRLAMQRANLSSVQLAHDVGVDKSVVTRWLAGTLRPADHSVAALSSVLARHVAQFSRADWTLSEPDFAARLGVTPPARVAQPALHNLLAPLLRGADQSQAAAAYPGLWALLIASPGGRGRLFGYASRIAAIPGGTALSQEVADADTFNSHGSLVAFGTRLFRVSQDVRRQEALGFMMLTGVAAGRAAILEGLALSHSANPEATPAAIPIVVLRLADTAEETAYDVARQIASSRNAEGWEAGLPEPLLARFRLAVPPPPAPSILRRPLAESWATPANYLNEPAMADRREALEAVRRIFAPALAG